MGTLNNLELIQKKQAERIVDVVLQRLNSFSEPGYTDSLHEELSELAQRVMTPVFEDYVEVESSNLGGISYDEESRVLRIDFHTGTRYHYFGLEPEKVRELLTADSKGSFFAKSIKPYYPWMKVS